MALLTRNELLKWLRYDSDSGIFYWKKRAANCCVLGAEAGWETGGGYRQIELLGKTYTSHRLAWLFIYGEWPQYFVRHINGDRSDNRPCNLSSLPNKESAYYRRRNDAPITQKRLKELLVYNTTSGIFTWRKGTSKFREMFSAKEAGTLVNGYISINVESKRYRAHRLAWLYVHGMWPSDQIDHIDGNRANNAMANLREASHQNNEANKPRRKDNVSGFKGVQYHRQSGKWRARITCNGKKFHLGLFGSPEEAHLAYVEAAKKIFGEFARAA